MDSNTKRDMKNLIKMFEARQKEEEEHDADVRDIAEMTQEAFNTVMGILCFLFYSIVLGTSSYKCVNNFYL